MKAPAGSNGGLCIFGVSVSSGTSQEDEMIRSHAAPSVLGMHPSFDALMEITSRPPVVFVRDGVARVVVRRETLDDLLRLDE